MPSATSGVSASGLGADYGEMSGHVGPTRVSASTRAARPGGRVDLSSLYEQRKYMYTLLVVRKLDTFVLFKFQECVCLFFATVLQTHSSLVEAKSVLNQKRSH